jgi:hypothetical protein
VSPQPTKSLGTNLAELTPSQVVGISQKRWAIEVMNWELKSGLGLGEHQVSGDTNRREKSVGIAVLASLLVMRVCHHEIVPGKLWSIFQLQHAASITAPTTFGHQAWRKGSSNSQFFRHLGASTEDLRLLGWPAP